MKSIRIRIKGQIYTSALLLTVFNPDQDSTILAQ